MIRFKIDAESTEILERITNIYNFGSLTVTSRIAVSLSIEKEKHFSEDDRVTSHDGREFTPTSNIFGRVINGEDNYVIFKSVFDQHYNESLDKSDFIRLYMLHLKDGLLLWDKELNMCNITKGEHITLLSKPVKKGLALRTNIVKTGTSKIINNVYEFGELLTFDLGKKEDGDDAEIRINDLNIFDNRNIAIAGMAGSGKTQLVKDILYQISKNTNNELKFIFFDYKGEGNSDNLKYFLEWTNCELVDIIEDGGVKFNPFLSINLEEKNRPFSVRALVDTISTFVPKMGVKQESILISLINELLDSKNGGYPTIAELFAKLESYYEERDIKQDTLYSIIRDLSTNIFNCNPDNPDILSKSLYLNLPPELSDTLRQLIVFLLLRYFNTYFSSTNDCIPNNYIFPLRYVIVIDEAHIYLKNRNARKALEDLLRLLRSKGVIIIMLTQGVEDYKTKDFDFASQVKLPICLNIQNKEYKSIRDFVGTPSSKFQLEKKIRKLESGKGLINIGEPEIIELRQWWKTEKNKKTFF